MSGIAEFLNALFKRPLVSWSALALAAGAGLLFLPDIKTRVNLDNHYYQLLSIGFLVVLLVSSAFLVVITTSSIGRRASAIVSAIGKEAKVLRKTQSLSEPARAILYLMVFNNEHTIWVMGSLAGAHELRVSGLFSLDDNYNGAYKYELDFGASRILQRNLAELHRFMPKDDLFKDVRASMQQASAAIENMWMSR